MASFYAELHLEGQAYPVRLCHFTLHQDTDARGRVVSKVHPGPLGLTLDVPEDDALLAWAAAPYKPLAGQIVFFDLAAQVPHETIAFTAGNCVGYSEAFASADTGQGAYVCHLVITALAFELRAGGPAAPLAAAVRNWAGAELAPVMLGSTLVGSSDDLPPVGTSTSISRASESSLLEIARAVNPLNGQENCTHITEAVVARLHGTNLEATAPNGPLRQLDALEAAHNTSVEFGKDFQQAFQIVSEGGEGTTAIVVIVPTDGSVGHVVTMTNRDGMPTIIEGQNWGPGQPAEVITSLARAERRYGANNIIGVGIVPPPQLPSDKTIT